MRSLVFAARSSSSSTRSFSAATSFFRSGSCATARARQRQRDERQQREGLSHGRSRDATASPACCERRNRVGGKPPLVAAACRVHRRSGRPTLSRREPVLRFSTAASPTARRYASSRSSSLATNRKHSSIACRASPPRNARSAPTDSSPRCIAPVVVAREQLAPRRRQRGLRHRALVVQLRRRTAREPPSNPLGAVEPFVLLGETHRAPHAPSPHRPSPPPRAPRASDPRDSSDRARPAAAAATATGLLSSTSGSMPFFSRKPPHVRLGQRTLEAIDGPAAIDQHAVRGMPCTPNACASSCSRSVSTLPSANPPWYSPRAVRAPARGSGTAAPRGPEVEQHRRDHRTIDDVFLEGCRGDLADEAAGMSPV